MPQTEISQPSSIKKRYTGVSEIYRIDECNDRKWQDELRKSQSFGIQVGRI